MKTISISRLKRALRMSWGCDTARGEWNPDNPSLNQCAVTALVVKHFLGGELLRCEMTDGGSHYWNLVEGAELDLTKDQFEHIEAKPKRETKVIRTTDYVLQNRDTATRYSILLNKVRKNLRR